MAARRLLFRRGMTNLETSSNRNQHVVRSGRRTFTTTGHRWRARAGGILTLVASIAIAITATACDPPPADDAAGGVAPAPEPELYRIDRIDVPTTYQELDQAGLDIDGDGFPDDAAGSILVVLMQHFDSARTQLPDSIARRLGGPSTDVNWLLELDRDPETGEVASVALRRGHDTDGDGRYQVPDLLSGRPSTVPATLLGDVLGTSDISWLDATAVAARVTRDTDGAGGVSGRIGFGLAPDRAAWAVAKPMARFLTERLQADALVYSATMDADSDGIITPDEFLHFSLIASLFAPDVDLNPDPGNDTLSAGFRIHASPVGLESRETDVVEDR